MQELRAENQSMMDLLADLRPLFRQERTEERDHDEIVETMQALRQVRAHFVRLQNIFFPLWSKNTKHCRACNCYGPGMTRRKKSGAVSGDLC